MFVYLFSYCIVFELVRVTKSCKRDKDFKKLGQIPQPPNEWVRKKGGKKLQSCLFNEL